MKAIVYSETGDPGVLRLTERAVPEPGEGEVRVRVRVSGVNPTDWKARRGGQRPPYPEMVPNQDGAGVVVEVAPAANAALNQAVVANDATIAVYATEATGDLTLPVLPHMRNNTRYQFVLVYTVPGTAKAHAVADVSEAVAAGALRVGEAAGLPLHHFPLADTGGAHAAVESGVVGKVLIDLD